MTAWEQISQHPINPVKNTLYYTGTDKAWARHYKPITKVTTHTFISPDDGLVYADFDKGFTTPSADDQLRMNAPAVGPNPRQWRFETEADCENWFHTEISNVVLAAWANYPSVWQTSHNKPLTDVTMAENIDITYSTKIGSGRVPLAIGEIKRNLISYPVWQGGNISDSEPQKKLSRELRGYAHKYRCPQVFCFDGKVLLLLQFRAKGLEDIQDEACPVDCWVFPRVGSGCTLRYGLHRLLVQGFLRCQGMSSAGSLKVGNRSEHMRQFFSGRPVWRVDGSNQVKHPDGYERSINAATGAVIWTHSDYPGVIIYETGSFW